MHFRCHFGRVVVSLRATILSRSRTLSIDRPRIRSLPTACHLGVAQRARASHNIETWRDQAANMGRMFAGIYGAEWLQERTDPNEELRTIRLESHRKYRLLLARNARAR